MFGYLNVESVRNTLSSVMLSPYIDILLNKRSVPIKYSTVFLLKVINEKIRTQEMHIMVLTQLNMVEIKLFVSCERKSDTNKNLTFCPVEYFFLLKIVESQREKNVMNEMSVFKITCEYLDITF